MSGLKTLALVCCIAGTSAPAGSLASDPQLESFAVCAGRLSALMEHQWSHDTAHVARTTAQRAAMIDLVAAILPPDAARDALHMQVNAKAAYAQLLRRATQNKDAADAAWAVRRAETLMRDCTAMLL